MSGIEHFLRVGIDIISIIVHPLCRLWGKNRVRVLCYHRVCNLPETDDVMKYLHVPLAAFTEQMAFLARGNYNIITLEQLIDYRDNNREPPPKTIIMTFDDGYRDNYVNAFPSLQRYNLKGTFFLVTDYIDRDRIFSWLKLDEKSLAHSQQSRQYWMPLSREEILSMSAQGACFGSHTKSHCHLNEIDPSKVGEELVGSREYLEEILATPVRCFGYPYGEVSKSVKALVKVAGYHSAVGTKWGSNTLKSDFLELRRITIEGKDSLGRFSRKVDGAYDWWFGWLVPLVITIQQIKFPRGQRK